MVTPTLRWTPLEREFIEATLQSFRCDQLAQFHRPARLPCLRKEPPRVDPRSPLRRARTIRPGKIHCRARIGPDRFDQGILRVREMRRQRPAAPQGSKNLKVIREGRASRDYLRPQPVDRGFLRPHPAGRPTHPPSGRHDLAAP